MGRPATGISRDARDWLNAYPWPGNIRELRNAIERAVLLCDGALITREHLPAAVSRPEPLRSLVTGMTVTNAVPAGTGLRLDEVERQFIEQAIRDSNGNKAKAARQLGLSRAQLYTRIERYGLRAQTGPERPVVRAQSASPVPAKKSLQQGRIPRAD